MTEKNTLGAVYQQAILNHNRNPIGFGALSGATYTITADNPVCGDQISVGVFFDTHQQHVEQVRFSDESCAICTASASLLCQQLSDIPIRRALRLAKSFVDFIETGQSLPSDELIPLQVFAELQHLPTRKRCATLPWTTLIKALQKAAD